MSDHTKALVPIDVWEFSSPDLKEKGEIIDIGLFAEALVYYDQVLVSVTNQIQLGRFIGWFIERGLLDDLSNLIKEGNVRLYNYAFTTNPFVNDTEIELWNINEEGADKPTAFVERFLNNPEVIKVFPDSKSHDEFCRLIDGKVMRVQATEFESAITNARADFFNPKRCSLLLQSLLDDLYLVKNLGQAPTVETRLTQNGLGEKQIRFDLDLNQIANHLGYKAIDNRATSGAVLASLAFSGAGNANKLLLSAMQAGIDLYLPRPLSLVTGDKLYEADLESATKSQETIEVLQEKVEFLDLRQLVNSGQIGFKDVLSIRHEAKQIRKWLQDGAERDRDIVYAYHHEVTKKAGFTKHLGKTLELFGKFSSGIGGVIGAIAVPDHPIIGTAIGGLVSDKLSFLKDVGAKMAEDWKPVIFGKWLKSHVEKIVAAKEAEDKIFRPIGIDFAIQRAEDLRKRRTEKRLKNKK